jgi:signal transduction histidine kinase
MQMLRNLTRSLSFRLLVIFLAMAVVFVYGATLAIRWVYSDDDLRELISGHLALHVDYVRRDIGNPPRIDRAIAITKKVPVDIRISGPDIDWASDPNFPPLAALDFGASSIFSEEPDAWLRELKNVEFAVFNKHRFLKITQGRYAIIVSSPRIADTSQRPDLVPIILGMGVFLLALSYLVVRSLFRPIDAIRQGTARIGRGDFDHRITDIRQDQLGDLAEDVNKLAADVRGMLDAKRQLMLGISHELRSPLTRLRLSLEFVEDGAGKESLRAEIDQMEQIVSTLLEAERLNTRHAALNRTEVQVRDLVDQLIDNYFERDRARIDVQFQDDSIVANVDDARLMLLIKNLLSNALRYSDPAAGPVTLSVSREKNELVIEVRDHGPGFGPEQAANIGEPFFRGDPSRTRQTGGAGLGLYLTKLVVEAHGGSLRLDPEYTGGARLVVRLPA